MDRDAIIALAKNLPKRASRGRSEAHGKGHQSDPAKTDFATLEVYKQMKTQRAVGDMAGLASPYFNLHEGRSGSTTIIDGKELINFACYDYLGLNGHEEVCSAARDAIDEYGTSVSASRPTGGDKLLFRNLEHEIADIYNSEDAIAFVSGHATNVSTIGDLMGPSDIILYDALSHNSISVGARLSGATRRSFAHNDFAELEKILRESRTKYDRALIVVEGHYSMDGDIPDLPTLIKIKNKYAAWLMVDEAHSLGVLGKTGRGIHEHFQIDPGDVDIWMGTMSKSLSACGGYIAGKGALIDILKFNASGFMYSVGMSPPTAAAASAALRVMLREPERVALLQENGRYFFDAARAQGLDTGLSHGLSIIPIIIGDSLRTVKLCNMLMERGIFTTPVTYPAVPMQEARLRFFISKEHSREQLDQAVQTTGEELEKLIKENYSLASISGNLDGM